MRSQRGHNGVVVAGVVLTSRRMAGQWHIPRAHSTVEVLATVMAFTARGVRIRTVNPYHRRGYYRRGYPYFAYGGYYPFGYYDDPLYDAGDQDAYAGVAANPDPSVNDSGLRNDVQALNDKVDRMQADAEARNRPVEQEPATALVFRDQHVEEVHNYAIAGETLWVLSDHQAGKKIPLAQLDIPATIRMNDDRGVDFQVPR